MKILDLLAIQGVDSGNLENKINCKIYMDLKGDLIFLESTSCPKFNGKYNLMKN